MCRPTINPLSGVFWQTFKVWSCHHSWVKIMCQKVLLTRNSTVLKFKRFATRLHGGAAEPPGRKVCTPAAAWWRLRCSGAASGRGCCCRSRVRGPGRTAPVSTEESSACSAISWPSSTTAISSWTGTSWAGCISTGPGWGSPLLCGWPWGPPGDSPGAWSG